LIVSFPLLVQIIQVQSLDWLTLSLRTVFVQTG